MADNRHFTDALQNEGGSPVYLEDKKLAERTPVSGAASIANLKFLLANDDTEGFNTAIKAYIDEAIRSALGALVNNLDKGTAISRILATDGNNDLGTITPVNLASVLGVRNVTFHGDIREIGFYAKTITQLNNEWFFVLRFNDSANFGELAIGINSAKVYYQTTNYTWQQL